MSGLPATGKSAVAVGIARATGWPVFSVDPIEAALWRAGIARAVDPVGRAPYEIAAALARAQLELGMSAIIDAVVGLGFVREAWRGMAADAGAPMKVIECVCRDPALHRARLEQRVRDTPREMEPTWDDVAAREYEPWTSERLVLDACEPLEANVAKAVRYVST